MLKKINKDCLMRDVNMSDGPPPIFLFFIFVFFFVMATPPLVPSCRSIFSHTEGTICAYAEGGGGSSNLKKRGKERGIR